MNEEKAIPQQWLTVYHPIAGWKACLMDKDHGPMQTGMQGYETKEEAIEEAKAWAVCEELPLIVTREQWIEHGGTINDNE
tara:strand:+ start:838 stop:1077 length:240 start_codon:yes stop_codon:yes gene_type:complete